MRENVSAKNTLVNAAIIIAIALLIACASSLKTAAQGTATQARALSLADIVVALRSKKADASEKNKLLSDAVKLRGITFALTAEIEKELESTGAETVLIAAIRERSPAPPAENSSAAKQPVKEVKPVEDFAFFRTRATSEIASGDAAAALADLDKAISMKADDPGVHHDKAMLLAAKDALPDAVAEYTKATELAPQDPRNFAGRAAAYERLNKPVEALSDYQRVLALLPADQNAAAAVVRVSSALTRAAIEAASKQTKAEEPKKDPVTAAEKKKVDTAEAPQSNDGGSSPVSVDATVVAGPVEVGNLTSYCTDMVKPVYPQMAIQTRTGGDVSVAITLDESGKIVDAKARSGTAVLRAAAENAVRRSKFAPVLKNGKPVKATGFLVFKFSI